jgi:hypothetical protein
MAMRDAATGETLFGVYSGRDTGRGMIGDVLPEVPGNEAWASLPGGSDSLGLYSAQGQVTTGPIPGTNMSVKWAADMTTQIVNGAGDVTPTIDDWRRGTLVTAEGTRTNNGTKGNPSLVADILGDWREEVLFRTADSAAIRIYLSTEVTDRKLYTLMHDPQYRAEVARQQTTYNQPSYTGFYLGSDINWSRVPVPDYWAAGSVDALRALLDGYVASGEVAGPVVWWTRGALGEADREVERGDARGAVRALDRFVRHLDRPGRWDTVSEAARTALTYRARTVIAML